MSFKIFNAVKNLFHTERQSLIKECDKYYRDVDEKIDYYKKYVKDNCPEYEYSNGYTSALLSMVNAKSLISYNALLSTNDSILKNVVEQSSRVNEIVNGEIEKLDKAIEESKISAVAFEEFVQNPSMFFVLENIFDGNKLYCFCYEFQAVNKDGKRTARALITDNETERCWIKEIKAEEEKIRSMTFEEFEENFLKERIEIQGFSKEEEIIEYDNYLRRLFNNQQ